MIHIQFAQHETFWLNQTAHQRFVRTVPGGQKTSRLSLYNGVPVAGAVVLY